MNMRVVLLIAVAVVILLVLIPEGASAAGNIYWTIGTPDGGTTRYEGLGVGDYAGYTFVRWEYLSGDGGTTWTVPEGVTAVDVLVVAGGGGGGTRLNRGGGGGGAGGVIYETTHDMSGYSSYISITVGAGGTGGSGGADGTGGDDSVFGTLTAIGGGGGGFYPGLTGGSGGGGSGDNDVGGSGIAGQGNDGGDGVYPGGTAGTAGGGGGKSEPGYNGDGTVAGNGGDGATYWGIIVAGGGGGGSHARTPGTGGAGGGGDGADAAANGEDGTPGTGGGGGGTGSGAAGDGGSGIVIIQYVTPGGSTPAPTGPTSTPINLTRPAANTTLAPISTSMYTGILDLFGNDQTITNESGAINWSGILPIVAGAYTAAMGKLGLILVFAIPFTMMWIVQRDTTLPGLVGLLLGLFIIVMLPVEMMHVAIAVMAMSITAVIYSLLKERM